MSEAVERSRFRLCWLYISFRSVSRPHGLAATSWSFDVHATVNVHEWSRDADVLVWTEIISETALMTNAY